MCALQALSADELRQAAAAYAQAAEELMDRHGLHRALFLCAKPFEPLAKLAAECLGSSGKQAAVFLITKDELPDQGGWLICDLLFESAGDGSLPEKAAGLDRGRSRIGLPRTQRGHTGGGRP